MANLRVEKFNMENPFVIASSPATHGIEATLKSASALPGAVTLRNFGHEAGGGSFVYPSAKDMVEGKEALQIHALGTLKKEEFHTLEEYCEGIKLLRSKLPSCVRLWASVGHFADTLGGMMWEDDWRRQAREVELAGADAIELHFNTPGVVAARDRVYDYYRMVYNTTRFIKKEVKLPVMVKLPVESCDPLRAMEAATFGGADAVGPTARWRGFVFDLDWKKTAARPGGGYGSTGALPVACYTVAEARRNGIDLPMYAGGGVYHWEGAAKLIMAGSDMVQLGSLACCAGPGAVRDTIRGLSDWMDQNGYESVSQLKGEALKLFNMTKEDTDKRVKALGRAYLLAKPDQAVCSGCGKCVDACWYEGIEINQGIAQKTKHCIGCGYCFSVCPTGALHVDAGRVLSDATKG